MVTLMSLCASNLLLQQNQFSPWNAGSTSKPLVSNKRCYHGRQRSRSVVLAITKGSAKSSKSRIIEQRWCKLDMLIDDACHQLSISTPSIKEASRINRRSSLSLIARSGSSTSSEGSQSDSKLTNEEKVSFGNSRKDVILIGVGVTIAGFALKYGLEFVGVDPLQAGNAVQLIFVLALTIGWISSYMFRVANKDMTYAQQLKDYEKKVMEVVHRKFIRSRTGGIA
ncbi:uncharacterized protein LOC144575798 isoform X2 [Carex rostrata]